MELEGDRCVLRRWRIGDGTALVAQANNPNVSRGLRDRFPHPYTLRDARGFLERAAPENPPTNLAIVVAGSIAGGVGFVPGNDIERYSAEVGYWLGEEYWGRGIATDALRVLTGHVFRDWKLLRLYALPLADNVASRRVLEKCGYVCEGILRASCVKFNRARDQAIYARINEALLAEPFIAEPPFRNG